MRLDSHVVSKLGGMGENDRARHLMAYAPSDAERARYSWLRETLDLHDRVRTKAYEEFNHLTLQRVLDRDRKAFNGYVPAKSTDPDESWRAQTVRPVTRNKVISIAAHVTSSLMRPFVTAQNENDDEDRDAALVMRDMVDWANQQSMYDRAFVRAVVKALVDPATFMLEGFAEVMRKVKVMRADGGWTEEEVMDEAFSGFLSLIVPCEEIYPANPYESDLQKQPTLIRQRFVPYSEAKAAFGSHPNFRFVEPGVRCLYFRNDGAFYKMRDEDLDDGMVEILTVWDRYEDLELGVVNGILCSDPDQPNPRADKRYPLAKTGYETFGGTDFFWYKSLASKMASDQEVIDRLYNIVIDGSMLKAMPPGVVIGDQVVDRGVVIPGAVTTFDENVSFQTINTNNDINSATNTLALVERSAAESSVDRLSQGMSADGTPSTAYEVSRLESNARTMLGLFGKMIAPFVEDFGNLRVSSVLQHMTVAEGAEVVGDASRLRFRKFLIPADAKGGKPKKIRFGMEAPKDDEEYMSASFRLLEEEHRTGSTIAEVNPDMFRRNKYLFRCKAEFIPEQSEAVKKALNLEAYDRAIRNPYVDQQKVTADFLLETYKPGESDKYIRKAQAAPQAEIAPGNSNVTSQVINRAMASGNV